MHWDQRNAAATLLGYRCPPPSAQSPLPRLHHALAAHRAPGGCGSRAQWDAEHRDAAEQRVETAIGNLALDFNGAHSLLEPEIHKVGPELSSWPSGLTGDPC